MADANDPDKHYFTDLTVQRLQDRRVRVRCPALELSLEADDVLGGLAEMKAAVLEELVRRDRGGEQIHPASFILSTIADDVVTVRVHHPRRHP